MKASQETDCVHRAETPCGDLRPFAEKIGGSAGVLRGCAPGLFLYAHIPRVREAWESQFQDKGGGSGELHECRMLFGGGPFPETYRWLRTPVRAPSRFSGSRRAGAHENTLEVK